MVNTAFARSTHKAQTCDLTDPTQYEALDYIFSQPNLTKLFLEVLQKNENTGTDVFKWHVKPGDHVPADKPIGTFYLLAPQFRRKPLTPQIYAPADCVITSLIKSADIFKSEILFSYKRLFPTPDVQEFMKSPHDGAKISKLQGHPDSVFWNLFPAIYALKRPEDRAQSSAQIDKFIQDEKSKMILAAGLTPPYPDLTPGL
jgi:hypothetical protein